MKSQEDTDRTNSSLSPAVLVWENPSLSESLNMICSNAQMPTSVYLHWRRTLQQQRWELCRWLHLDDCTWKRTLLSISLDLTGKQQWDLEGTIFSITGDQRQRMSYYQESGTWQRPAIAGTSFSTTYPSWFLLRKTEMNGKPLTR